MQDTTVLLPITGQEAQDARIKNIIEIGLGFSVMTRVFSKRSNATILKRLEEFFKVLDGVNDKAEYDRFHADFCQWFMQSIRTAERKLKNGQTKPSRACSYGQAAKVLDVSAKVYVYYCAEPSLEAALRLVPMLHAALDTPMMHLLGLSTTLQEVDRDTYEELQSRVTHEIALSQIHPVQYDDIMWRHLQRPQSPALP
jgi:DNA primase